MRPGDRSRAAHIAGGAQRQPGWWPAQPKLGACATANAYAPSLPARLLSAAVPAPGASATGVFSDKSRVLMIVVRRSVVRDLLPPPHSPYRRTRATTRTTPSQRPAARSSPTTRWRARSGAARRSPAAPTTRAITRATRCTCRPMRPPRRRSRRRPTGRRARRCAPPSPQRTVVSRVVSRPGGGTLGVTPRPRGGGRKRDAAGPPPRSACTSRARSRRGSRCAPPRRLPACVRAWTGTGHRQPREYRSRAQYPTLNTSRWQPITATSLVHCPTPGARSRALQLCFGGACVWG